MVGSSENLIALDGRGLLTWAEHTLLVHLCFSLFAINLSATYITLLPTLILPAHKL